MKKEGAGISFQESLGGKLKRTMEKKSTDSYFSSKFGNLKRSFLKSKLLKTVLEVGCPLIIITSCCRLLYTTISSGTKPSPGTDGNIAITSTTIIWYYC